MTIYLSTNGNDANDGLSRETAVLTPRTAALRARETGADTVCVGGGDYYLNEPLTLGKEDSGRTWTADAGAHPRFLGAAKIGGWVKHDALRNIWRAEVPFGLRSRDLFVNGKRFIRAKAKGVTAVAFTDDGIVFSDKGMPMLAVARDAEIILNNFWNQPRIGASSVEYGKSGILLRMKQPAWKTYMTTASLGGAPADASQFDKLENAYEFLSEPGEWYLDSRTDELFVIPEEGTDLGEAEVFLGAGEHLIVLNGVSGVTFRGFTFTGTTWLQASSDEGLVTIQANFRKGRHATAETRWDERNWLAPAACVYGEFCTDTVFENNTFIHLGTGGIHLGRATRSCRISHNIFRDCAGTGVTVGAFKNIDRHPERSGGTSAFSDGNTVDGNIIEYIGVDSYAASVGVCCGYVRNTSVVHNTIAHTPYSAVSFGWGWAWGGAELCNELTGNSLSFNRVYDVMNVLFDGGGLYLLGRMDGMLVECNYISEVNNDYGAIYLDNGCQGFTVRNNVIRSAHRNYIYKGDYHTIKNNYAEKSRVQPDLPMPELCDSHDSHLIFEDNYLTDESIIAGIMASAGASSDKVGAY